MKSYITIADSKDWEFDNTPFTIDFWYKHNKLTWWKILLCKCTNFFYPLKGQTVIKIKEEKR